MRVSCAVTPVQPLCTLTMYQDGTCELVLEQANPDALSELSQPLDSIANHTMLTPSIP